MINRGQFENLKKLAREKRKFYNVDTAHFGLREVRAIYKAEDIRIDNYFSKGKIKALYMCDDGHYSVAVQKTLPDEPKIFALIHELKHHYCDQELLKKGHIHCGDFNMSDPIEVGAEIFAAEFIYPLEEFSQDISPLKIKTWTKEDIVKFKKICKAKVSYRFLCRRLAELGLINFKEFEKVKFQNLEDQMYGAPYHRRRKMIKKSA